MEIIHLHYVENRVPLLENDEGEFYWKYPRSPGNETGTAKLMAALLV